MSYGKGLASFRAQRRAKNRAAREAKKLSALEINQKVGGLCPCYSGCSGLSLEMKEEQIYLYVHAQRGTQAGQSNWIRLRDTHPEVCELEYIKARSDVKYFETREKRHSQKCCLCSETPKEKYFRISSGGSANQTMHESCLRKIVNLSYPEKLDSCARSINPSSRVGAFLQMEPEQLEGFDISESQLKKWRRDAEWKKAALDITESHIEEFLAEATVAGVKNKYNHEEIYLVGKCNGLTVKMKLSAYAGCKPSDISLEKLSVTFELRGKFTSSRKAAQSFRCTSSSIKKRLQKIGLPILLASDNGGQMNPIPFVDLEKMNVIQQIKYYSNSDDLSYYLLSSSDSVRVLVTQVAKAGKMEQALQLLDEREWVREIGRGA